MSVRSDGPAGRSAGATRAAGGDLVASARRRRCWASTKLCGRSPPATRSTTTTGYYGVGDGAYSYKAADGVRWRFVFRRSDGTQTTKRGFLSEKAARDAGGRLVEQIGAR
jgi:hypothetical protein